MTTEYDRKFLVLKGRKEQEAGEKYLVRSFRILIPKQILLWLPYLTKQDKMWVRMGEKLNKKNSHKLLVWKFVGKRPLGRSRFRWRITLKLI